MVSKTSLHAHQSYLPASHNASNLLTMGNTNRTQTSSTSQITPPSCSHYLSPSRTAKGIPTHINKYLTSAVRPKTASSYETYGRKWTDFCSQRKANSSLPTVMDVLEFLHHFTDNGTKKLGGRYFPRIIAALKWKLHPRVHKVLEHVYIRRFMDAYFNTNPPPP